LKETEGKFPGQKRRRNSLRCLGSSGRKKGGGGRECSDPRKTLGSKGIKRDKIAGKKTKGKQGQRSGTSVERK